MAEIEIINSSALCKEAQFDACGAERPNFTLLRWQGEGRLVGDERHGPGIRTAEQVEIGVEILRLARQAVADCPGLTYAWQNDYHYHIWRWQGSEAVQSIAVRKAVLNDNSAVLSKVAALAVEKLWRIDADGKLHERSVVGHGNLGGEGEIPSWWAEPAQVAIAETIPRQEWRGWGREGVELLSEIYHRRVSAYVEQVRSEAREVEIAATLDRSGYAPAVRFPSQGFCIQTI